MQETYFGVLRVEMSSAAYAVAAITEDEVRRKVATILAENNLFDWVDIYRINPDFSVDEIGYADRMNT